MSEENEIKLHDIEVAKEKALVKKEKKRIENKKYREAHKEEIKQRDKIYRERKRDD